MQFGRVALFNRVIVKIWLILYEDRHGRLVLLGGEFASKSSSEGQPVDDASTKYGFILPYNRCLKGGAVLTSPSRWPGQSRPMASMFLLKFQWIRASKPNGIAF
jgi:hypothetical protein